MGDAALESPDAATGGAEGDERLDAEPGAGLAKAAPLLVKKSADWAQRVKVEPVKHVIKIEADVF